MKYAIASREMQFCAGPQKHTFYACRIHLPEMIRGSFESCFFPTREGVKPVNPEDEMDCDLCREG